MATMPNMLRRVISNRRRHPRKRRVCEANLRSEHNLMLFRGKTVNISSSGARIQGLPINLGIAAGHQVRVEILFRRAAVPSRSGASTCGPKWSESTKPPTLSSSPSGLSTVFVSRRRLAAPRGPAGSRPPFFPQISAGSSPYSSCSSVRANLKIIHPTEAERRSSSSPSAV